MTDHRWLCLARVVSRFPDSLAGYVVTKNDKLILGCGTADEAAEVWDDCSLYFCPGPDVVEVMASEEFNSLARIVIPSGLVLLGVDLDIEIEAIDL